MNLPPHSNFDFENPNVVTPWAERAPLFAHECIGLYDGGSEEAVHEESQLNVAHSVPEEAVDLEVDVDDPTLEPFPHDRPSILEHVRSAETRLGEDRTAVDGPPPSPLASSRKVSVSQDLPVPSPALLTRTLSLISISEDAELKDGLSLPNSGDTAYDSSTEELLDRRSSQDAMAPVPENRIFSDGERYVSAIGAGDDGPNSQFQPASSQSYLSGEPGAKIGESSARDENPTGSKLKKRFQATNAAIERPVTPSSIRSNAKDVGNGSFLQVIWRTICVGWIGGWIARICGGRRKA